MSMSGMVKVSNIIFSKYNFCIYKGIYRIFLCAKQA